MSKKSFLAKVKFDSRHELSDLANRLGRTTGVTLRDDESGRYDEIPAFVGEHAGLEMSLLGTPEDHPSYESELIVRMRTELSFDALHVFLPEFFRSVLVDKLENERGYIDCSGELRNALVAQGFSDCSLMI